MSISANSWETRPTSSPPAMRTITVVWARLTGGADWIEGHAAGGPFIRRPRVLRQVEPRLDRCFQVDYGGDQSQLEAPRGCGLALRNSTRRHRSRTSKS